MRGGRSPVRSMRRRQNERYGKRKSSTRTGTTYSKRNRFSNSHSSEYAFRMAIEKIKPLSDQRILSVFLHAAHAAQQSAARAYAMPESGKVIIQWELMSLTAYRGGGVYSSPRLYLGPYPR